MVIGIEEVGTAGYNMVVAMPHQENALHKHWFNPINIPADTGKRDYIRAAARLFVVFGGSGYCCHICNDLTGATGGGGWWQNAAKVVEHIMQEHPEACRVMHKMMLAASAWVNKITPAVSPKRRIWRGKST